jgi:hypothetical protein
VSGIDVLPVLSREASAWDGSTRIEKSSIIARVPIAIHPVDFTRSQDDSLMNMGFVSRCIGMNNHRSHLKLLTGSGDQT